MKAAFQNVKESYAQGTQEFPSAAVLSEVSGRLHLMDQKSYSQVDWEGLFENALSHCKKGTLTTKSGKHTNKWEKKDFFFLGKEIWTDSARESLGPKP